MVRLAILHPHGPSSSFKINIKTSKIISTAPIDNNYYFNTCRPKNKNGVCTLSRKKMHLLFEKFCTVSSQFMCINVLMCNVLLKSHIILQKFGVWHWSLWFWSTLHVHTAMYLLIPLDPHHQTFTSVSLGSSKYPHELSTRKNSRFLKEVKVHNINCTCLLNFIGQNHTKYHMKACLCYKMV